MNAGDIVRLIEGNEYYTCKCHTLTGNPLHPFCCSTRFRVTHVHSDCLVDTKCTACGADRALECNHASGGCFVQVD